MNIVSDFFSNTESKYLPRISQSCINILVHLIRPGNWRMLRIQNPLSVTCICNITRIKALGPIYLSEITLNYKRHLKNNGPVISPNCRAWRPFLIQKFILLCNFFQQNFSRYFFCSAKWKSLLPEDKRRLNGKNIMVWIYCRKNEPFQRLL